MVEQEKSHVASDGSLKGCRKLSLKSKQISSRNSAFMACIQDVPSLNLSWDTNCLF
jgi:hypothetical protein